LCGLEIYRLRHVGSAAVQRSRRRSPSLKLRAIVRRLKAVPAQQQQQPPQQRAQTGAPRKLMTAMTQIAAPRRRGRLMLAQRLKVRRFLSHLGLLNEQNHVTNENVRRQSQAQPTRRCCAARFKVQSSLLLLCDSVRTAGVCRCICCIKDSFGSGFRVLGI
jgi:hypothetical protein